MGEFFSMDGGFMSALAKIFDICLLSILWFICCIPIITVGASTTALYYAIVKVVRRERGYTAKEFLKSFKLNFVNGTIVWIIILAIGILLYGNMRYSNSVGGNLGFVLLCIYRAMFFVLLSVTVYVFPNLSRFTMTRKQLVKNSFFMSMKHLPTTIVVVAIVFLTAFIIQVMPISFIFIPALSCLLASFLMERVLKLYMPKPTDDVDNTSDEWYLE